MEMSQTVVNDLCKSLQARVPISVKLDKEFLYHIKIQIRDGVIKLLDVEVQTNDHNACRLADDQHVDVLLHSIEKWLHKVLPTTLYAGYHGWIRAAIGMEQTPPPLDSRVARLVFRKHCGNQVLYDWSHLPKVP